MFGVNRALASLAAMIVGSAFALRADAAAQSPPTLRTRWTEQAARSEIPLPEHPSPQLRRDRWQCLNGRWELALTERDAARPAAYPDRILVPYPVESLLSGVRRAVTPTQRVWYRRTFSPPPMRDGERLLLHFGAVDWEATVWVNGSEVGTHRGGYDPFTFDVTAALRDTGEQELVVSVWDPTNEGSQPRGKQVLSPRGIWYTAVTGIWQTVWLEPVPAAHVEGLRLVADPASERLLVTVDAVGGAPGVQLEVVVSEPAAGRGAARTVGSATGVPGVVISVPVPHPRLWSPDDPYLYDVEVRLEGGDVVHSYAGLRTVSVERAEDGYVRLFLNGAPIFHFGLLDQGWWPDGLYTAPTDDALRYDLEVTKRLGFNTIRKHVKVEPARWYYHADRLGLLVWQDMPSGDNRTDEARTAFARELEALVASRANSPSIVMWVPFNEGWGQHDAKAWAERIRALDPSRPVNHASGWTDEGGGDVSDVHRYPGPGMPEPEARRAAVLGEFGGLGLPLAGHTWLSEGNWGYRGYGDREALGSAYRALLVQLHPLIGEGLAGAIYTQTTDVEIEVNGVMTYDREVVKLPEGIAEDHARLFTTPPVVREIVSTSRTQGQVWQYRTVAPPQGWQTGRDGEAGWRAGPGGFGSVGTPGARVGTAWTGPELWIRRSFELEAVPDSLWLRVHHDEDAEVWVNGTLVATLEGYTTGYALFPLDAAGMASFRPGANMLAAYVRQTQGGQYLDVGIVRLEAPGRARD